jgi:hypothetical protein
MTAASPSLRELALNVLKKRDTAWDSRGTVDQKVSQGQKAAGTVKSGSIQTDNPTVPVSYSLSVGQWDTSHKTGTPLGTVVGRSRYFAYAEALGRLEAGCPEYVEAERWQQCLIDAQRFVAAWGDKALALGWSDVDLFGLHDPPAKRHPSYSRLSRLDCMGLIWILGRRRVVALSANSAGIENPTGTVTIYRKPSLCSVGGSFR